MKEVIAISLYWLKLVLCYKIWSILESDPWTPRLMFILQLGGIFFRYLLRILDIYVSLFFVCVTYVFGEWNFKVIDYFVLESICAFKSSIVSFMKLGVQTFDAYIFTFVMITLLIGSGILCLFWLIVVGSLLCQIWAQLLLLAFRFHLLRKSCSFLSLYAYVCLCQWGMFLVYK
jgi:hypothetical protein